VLKAGRKNTALPRLSFIVKGKKIRTSTSSDTLSHSSNPVWILRDYLTDDIYGVGLDDSLLDDASFTAMGAMCDVQLGSGVATHSCNLIVDTAKPLMENVKRILSTCNGSLVWVSGKYHVKIATTLVGDPAMTFDTSNIIGGISIKCESKADKANQVIAKYITGVTHSDDQTKNWQEAELTWPDKIDDADLYTQYFETEDNSVPLRKTIALKGVTDHNQVRYLAQQACLQSRNNILVSFTSTAEALNLLPNDIISITHDTAGWTAKEFRVINLTLNNNGTVSIVCHEYQASTYTWSHQDIPAVTDDTNLPDPNSVSAPLDLN
jgi:predicted phage tail protein